MKSICRRILSILLALCCLAAVPGAVFAAPESYVTQTSMVRALQTMLKTTAPIGEEYTAKSEHGGAAGNLGFAQTFFYNLFLSELSATADLSAASSVTLLASFPAGDTAAAGGLSTAVGALRFGDLIQYGKTGKIAPVLGSVSGKTVTYDCGFAPSSGEDKTVRLRLVGADELREQALTAGNEGGLYLYRPKNVPATDITLNLLSKPAATTYYLNAEPKPDGVTLEYTSRQAGKQQITAESEELSVFASTKEAGEVPMIFLYGSAFTFCTLEVKNETVESVSIKVGPTRREYTTEETVDMAGAEVVAKMKDGTELVLKDGEYTLTYAFTAPGNAVVTVSYGGKADTFSVTVKEPPVLKLSVVAPEKTTYFVGERLDLSGGKLIVDFEKQKNVTVEMLESMLSAYDTSLPGKQVITVTYGSKTGTFEITVTENRIAALQLNTPLAKNYRKGASLNLSSVELLVLYEDGQSRVITARDCTVFIGGKETSTFERAGEAEVVFTYQNVSTTASAVNVTEDPMEAFLRTLIIIVACLVGIPLIVFGVIWFIRRKKGQNAPTEPEEGDFSESFPLPEEDGDVRIFRAPGEEGTSASAADSPTIHVPEVGTNTILIPKLPDEDPNAAPEHKIDFFDDI